MKLKILLALLSGLLLVLAYPSFEFWPLAFIAFAPLLSALKKTTVKQSFFISYLTGLTFFTGLLYWITKVTLFLFVPLVLYISLYFGVFGILTSFFLNHHWSKQNNFNKLHFILIPAIWVSLELLRTSILGRFGWGLLGYSQYKNLPLIQIADIGGIYCISFLVMLINFTIYLIFKDWDKTETKFAFFISLIILVSSLSYGNVKLTKKYKGDYVRISIIPGNIPNKIKKNPKYADAIFNKYLTLSQKATKDKPDLIVWPETSFPGIFDKNFLLKKLLFYWTKQSKIPLLIGAKCSHKNMSKDPYNSAILIVDASIQQYNKIHLVPCGEYYPLSDCLPKKMKKLDCRSAGNTLTIFELPLLNNKTKFATLICFEVIFPHLARKFVDIGAKFLVNISNDFFFRNSPASYQQLQALVFRTIENRIPAVRVDNWGTSCFITSAGVIYETVNKDNLSPSPSYKTEPIKIDGISTVYTKYGDWFAYICLLLVVLFLLDRFCFRQRD